MCVMKHFIWHIFYFLSQPKLHLQQPSSVWCFSIFRSASAAWADIKILQTFQRQHYANQAEREKPLKSFPVGDWRYLMVLRQLPSMTILQWVALCWVKACCFLLLWIFVSLISSVHCWNLAVHTAGASRGGSFQTFAKDLVSNTYSKTADTIITGLFDSTERIAF